MIQWSKLVFLVGFLAILLGFSRASVDNDMTDDILSCGSATDIDEITDSTAMSISFWFRWSTVGTGGVGGWAVTKDDWQNGFGLRGATQGGFTRVFNQREAATTTTMIILTDNSGQWTADTWHHVAAVWATGGSQLIASAADLYLDGVLTTNDTETNGSGTDINDSAFDFKIGADAGLAEMTDGEMARVAIWGAALTQSDATALASGAPRIETRVSAGMPIRYWPLMGHVEGQALTVANSLLDLANGGHCSPTGSPAGKSRPLPW